MAGAASILSGQRVSTAKAGARPPQQTLARAMEAGRSHSLVATEATQQMVSRLAPDETLAWAVANLKTVELEKIEGLEGQAAKELRGKRSGRRFDFARFRQPRRSALKLLEKLPVDLQPLRRILQCSWRELSRLMGREYGVADLQQQWLGSVAARTHGGGREVWSLDQGQLALLFTLARPMLFFRWTRAKIARFAERSCPI